MCHCQKDMSSCSLIFMFSSFAGMAEFKHLSFTLIYESNNHHKGKIYLLSLKGSQAHIHLHPGQVILF